MSPDAKALINLLLKMIECKKLRLNSFKLCVFNQLRPLNHAFYTSVHKIHLSPPPKAVCSFLYAINKLTYAANTDNTLLPDKMSHSFFLFLHVPPMSGEMK